MAARETVREFDLARVISMLAVIMIHITAPYMGRTSEFTVLGMNLAFLLNQVTRFAVPLFLLLSGASLGFSQSGSSPAVFYKKRAIKIGIPYLVWFSLYYVYHLLHTQPAPHVTAGAFFRSLLQGQSAPHLYFIIILAQCYLLYPLLKQAVARRPGWSVAAALACTASIEVLMALRQAGMDFIPPLIRPYLWLLFPTWAFYFVLGMTLTRERVERLRDWVAAHAWGVLLFALAFAGGYVVLSRQYNALDSIKLTLNLYVPVVLAASFALWQLVGRFRWVQRGVAFLSAHAMTVYFSHVFVIYHFQKIDWFTRGMTGMLALYLVVTLVSVPFAWLLDTAGRLVFTHKA